MPVNLCNALPPDVTLKLYPVRIPSIEPMPGESWYAIFSILYGGIWIPCRFEFAVSNCHRAARLVSKAGCAEGLLAVDNNGRYNRHRFQVGGRRLRVSQSAIDRAIGSLGSADLKTSLEALYESTPLDVATGQLLMAYKPELPPTARYVDMLSAGVSSPESVWAFMTTHKPGFLFCPPA